MGQALYRKYRSKSFDDVIGQEHITDTLKKAVESGRISHAYLFTGPKGVGKTSVARILAHEVNGLPYTDESIHLDIIEIDAASNRRIDEIRELRDKVHTSPTSAKYKVYIIDEVHMLTREAFNALLKTLEEPPAHCIFILATTEAHKLPETIISRTQRYEFKPIASSRAVNHLMELAKKEKIDVDTAALELLAEHGDGSFRDSISLLDQLSSSGDKITEASVRNFLGLPQATSIDNLVNAITGGHSDQALVVLDELKDQGANPTATARMLAKSLRRKLIAEPATSWVPDLLRRLIEVPASSRPEDSLEVAVLEICSAHPSPSIEETDDRPQIITQSKKVTVAPIKEDEQEPLQEEPDTLAQEDATINAAQPFDQDSWGQIIERVKAEAASLYTALRLANPRLEGDKLILVFQFPLHQKKINQAQARDLIGRIVAEVIGQKLSIEATVNKTVIPDDLDKKTAKKHSADIKTISNIFGNAEVLES